jgi:acyl-CoA reductase-like NAD-dependent aldehyde dehydrogenase
LEFFTAIERQTKTIELEVMIMPKKFKVFINGEWVDSTGGGSFEDFNPFTGDIFATITSAGKNDAKKAIEAASAAFPEWSATPPSDKRMILLKAAEILEKRQQEVAQILIEETGAPFGWGMFQTILTTGIFREAASQVHRVTGEIIPADLPGAFFMALRQPVGVVAGIAPWNAPLILSLRSVVFPLAYGNTAVLKPSAESPVSGGIVIAEIFEEAGIPKGVLNVITNGPGRSGEIGEEFITDPKVRRISFTGSTEIGKLLAEKAGRHLKKVTLELGGQDPLIILEDADIDRAVNAAAFGRFLHQGQVCMSTKRIIVEEPVAEEFTAKFVAKASGLKVGDPREPDTVIGPLINQGQLDKIKSCVEESVAAGAKLLCGGKNEGLCYYPTVLNNVKDNMKVLTEETFGPVAPIITVKNVEEAIHVANDSAYGLSSGIMTEDLQKGLEIAEKLETGMAHINDATLHDEPQAPFGGMKDSGWGRHGGLAAMEEFTEIRWITMQRTPRHYPF